MKGFLSIAAMSSPFNKDVLYKFNSAGEQGIDFRDTSTKYQLPCELCLQELPTLETSKDLRTNKHFKLN